MSSTEAAFDASSSTTSMKRKIDEAFDALDDALQSRDRPSPAKRANASIYSSLAKYGIRTFNKPSTSKTTSTPTLSALLSRSRSRKQRKPLIVSQLGKSSSTVPEYSPCSTEAFLQRLSTFSLSTYSSKPPQIDAVAASKAGWINEGGKDRLHCSICKVGWVLVGRDGMSKDASSALVEKQRQSLVEMHKEGCPWRVRQCDSLVYRIPLQSPTGLARQIKSQAAELQPIMDGVAIRHPLSSTQVQSLIQTITSVQDEKTMISPSPVPSSDETESCHLPLPSPTCLLTSLFGWSLVPVPQPMVHQSHSASLTVARTTSRASSVPNALGSSREASPSPSAFGTPAPFTTPAMANATVFNTPVNSGIDIHSQQHATGTVLSHCEPPKQKDALLQCRMCQRRVGLWAFATPNPPVLTPSQHAPSINRSQRQFDILREHRSYCPYVVKSTPLPSVPSYPAPPPSPTPRSSFNLNRTGTSSSLAEGQGSNSTFHLRRTSSLLSGAASLARTGTLSSNAPSASTEHSQNLVEGWRAVLSVVLRYGMAERSRVRPLSLRSTPASIPQAEAGAAEKGDDDAMNGVVALVDGVKQHGGRQLLSYIRSLLG